MVNGSRQDGKAGRASGNRDEWTSNAHLVSQRCVQLRIRRRCTPALPCAAMPRTCASVMAPRPLHPYREATVGGHLLRSSTIVTRGVRAAWVPTS